MEPKRHSAGALALALVISLASYAAAQSNGFRQTNLISDIPGVALRTDKNLVNPWGIVASPGRTIWLADNGTGDFRTPTR